ncbi:hypothetical protein ACHAQA_009659 [Verticillium albo-atrum]
MGRRPWIQTLTSKKTDESWTMTRFLDGLGSQAPMPEKDCRVKIFQFNDVSDDRQIAEPKNAAELEDFFDARDRERVATPPDGQEKTTQPKLRTVFVVEDMTMRYVDILGRKLGVCPNFFARHLIELGVLESMDELFPDPSDVYSFAVPFFEVQAAPRIMPESGCLHNLEELYRIKSNVSRLVAFPKPHGTFDLRGTVVEIQCLASYWSRVHDDGSWDVVILVDPPLGDELLSINSDCAIKIKEAEDGDGFKPYFSPDPPRMVRDGNGDWKPTETKRHGCIFDEVSDEFSCTDRRASADPFEMSGVIRKIALRQWNDFLNHAMHCLVLTKGEPYLDNTHFSSPIAMLWEPGVQEWLLGRMVKWSRRLHIEFTVVSSIMRRLGIDPSDSRSRGRLSAGETKKWHYVADKTLEYKSLYDDMATSYMQVMSLRESLTSNTQARGVGRLTVMGVLFVPVSLSTGLLSMAEPFTPGQNKFWVFFVLVVPITLVLAMFVLGADRVSEYKARKAEQPDSRIGTTSMFGFNPPPPEPYLEAPSLSFLAARHPLKGLLHALYHLVNDLRGNPPPRYHLKEHEPRVRIVCISDTHTLVPSAVPDGDILIHAGDLTNDGTVADLQTQIDWIAALPHPHKIAIAGNHDTYLDPSTRASLPIAQRAEGLLDWKTIHYLQHSALTLTLPSGRQLNFYGAPQIPACGPYETFAFQHARGEDTWTGTVPDDTDVLITHAPPKYHRDLPVPTGLGCGFLLAEVRRVKPVCHIFGHVHWGAGREVCWWDGVQQAYESGLGATTWRDGWGLLSLRVWASLATVASLGVFKAVWGRVSRDSGRPTIMVNAAQMKGHTGKLGNAVQVVDI